MPSLPSCAAASSRDVSSGWDCGIVLAERSIHPAPWDCLPPFSDVTRLPPLPPSNCFAIAFPHHRVLALLRSRPIASPPHRVPSTCTEPMDVFGALGPCPCTSLAPNPIHGWGSGWSNTCTDAMHVFEGSCPYSCTGFGRKSVHGQGLGGPIHAWVPCMYSRPLVRASAAEKGPRLPAFSVHLGKLTSASTGKFRQIAGTIYPNVH